MSEEDRASQLVVILDCNPHIWNKYNRPTSSLFPNRNLFVDVVDQLAVFLKAYLVCGRSNGLCCIASHCDQNTVIYKSDYGGGGSGGGSSVNRRASNALSERNVKR